ncbi:MAG: nucleotide exchange factor GrpE [Caldimicrobium sp.]|nr:nucleotide exchange factor GrpE [Caldimicrobium sp.]MCX7874226.1 nucleotide exchange factor GrpE [Caldimicrobium sp.]MDW8094630.1 nucleotide exchange factor GrpE [Caldimicrobium sp.]
MEEEKVSSLEEELKEWKDRALRYAAELENLKKAFKREKEEYFKFALETVFKELLPTVDNLEMALTSFETSNNIEALKQGVELTLKVLVQTLEKFGLKQFEPTIGDPFHPHFHEAIHAEPHEEVPEGSIIKVFQKGYQLHDRIIRPALVCVCQGSPKTSSKESPNEEESQE